MTKFIQLLAALAICTASSGCVIPYHFTARPGLKGTVVDARTKTPVAGADVTLGPPYRASVHSAADGSFVILPLKQWGVYVIPADYFGTRFPVVVQRSGYQPYHGEVISSYKDGVRGQNTAQIGPVALSPTR